MKITERQTRIMRAEVIEFEDGEIRASPFSRDGKQYRVDSAIIEWASHDGGDTWDISKVEARGQVLKRDGSDSKNRTDERFYRNTPRPEWLADLIADTDPTEDAR